MLSLSSSFAALADYRQFIIWQLNTKIPFDYRTGKKGNINDKNTHTDFMSAAFAAEKYNCGVGFVITEDDPFFFLDCDAGKHSDEEAKQNTAKLIKLFIHAGIEISQSKNGYHIVGKVNKPLVHKCKNKKNHLELYTSNKYIALTQYQTSGNVLFDCNSLLPDVIEEYFKKDTTKQIVFDTDAKENDDLILEKALNAKNGSSIFGNSVTFKDLFYANENVLSKIYVSSSDVFDRSSADAALAMHLAFWCAKNVDQIKRLMFRSSLVREKWNRENYINNTILSACEKQKSEYKFEQKTTNKIDSILTKIETVLTEIEPKKEAKSEINYVSLNDIFTNPEPQISFIVDKIIPRGVLTLLSAHGGAGKSMMSLYLSVALSRGVNFFSKELKKSKVLFYSGEDSTRILRIRLAKICRALNIPQTEFKDDYLRVIDATKSPTLFYESAIKGVKSFVLTERYEQLKNEIETYLPDLIVVDNSSEVYAANENDRTLVRAFIKSLVELTEKSNAAILLLSHVDKMTVNATSKATFSGSTAWHNSARSRLFLAHDKDQKDRLILSHQKSNLCELNEDLHMRWTQNGFLEEIKST